MSDLIGDIKTMVAQWHYYKSEVLELLATKVNLTDVPSKTSDLTNDVPYAKENELMEIKQAINRFGVTFDSTTGILTFRFPRFQDE